MRLRARQDNVPAYTDYTKYKRYVREDFAYECVFCSVHENDLGGPRGMHIEHLRPKALERFAHLECEYTNLLYSCPICNPYKGTDWPSDNPVADGRGYPDPCEVDYDDHIAVSLDHRVEGLTDVGRYLVQRLHLNRRQLKKLRENRALRRDKIQQRIRLAEETIVKAESFLEQPDLSETVRGFFIRAMEVADAERAEAKAEWDSQFIPLYTLEDYRE